MCRDIVGPALQQQGKTEGYNWLMQKAINVPVPYTLSSSNKNSVTVTLSLLTLSLLFLS